jgi:hypothetical protein
VQQFDDGLHEIGGRLRPRGQLLEFAANFSDFVLGHMKSKISRLNAEPAGFEHLVLKPHVSFPNKRSNPPDPNGHWEDFRMNSAGQGPQTVE